MLLGCAMLAVAISAPRPDQKLPFVERCYVLGSVEQGVTNVVVQGLNVPVYRTGAWAACVDVTEGENTITAVCEGPDGRSEATRRFTVAVRPKPKAESANDGKPAEPVQYKKLECAGDFPRSHPSAKTPSELTVVVDPGHGGKTDKGCITPHGWFEKDANLLLAEAVREELVKLGYRVVLTRRNDREIKIYDRPKAIYAVGGDAFISIHHNSPPLNRDASVLRYAAVYSWNPLGDAMARAVAKRMDDVQRSEMKSNGAMHANFAVIRNPEIPSCLIEADFITHPAGEEAAWDPVRRQKLAEAIAAGFSDWHKGVPE